MHDACVTDVWLLRVTQGPRRHRAGGPGPGARCKAVARVRVLYARRALGWGESPSGAGRCVVCVGGGVVIWNYFIRGKVLLPRNTSMENRQCTGIRLGCDSILPACALARRNRHTSAYRARAPHPQPSHLMKAESFAWNSSASIAFCRKAKAVRDAMVGARGELERGAVAPADRLRARSRLSSC